MPALQKNQGPFFSLQYTDIYTYIDVYVYVVIFHECIVALNWHLNVKKVTHTNGWIWTN